MPQVRVIACKDRIRPRKGLENSDGYVYTLEFDGPQKSTRYLILFGYKEDLFKPDPSLLFVNPEHLTRLEEQAKKQGEKLFNAYESLCKMGTVMKQGAYTDEKASPEVLAALQDYEVNQAKEFERQNGYWPPALEIALPRGKAIMPSALIEILANR